MNSVCAFVVCCFLVGSLAQSLPDVSVKSYGAIGNGVADDNQAIYNAVQAVVKLNGKATLVFPAGTYRVGRDIYDPNQVGSIDFRGVDQVHIRFDGGSVLLMDNLNGKNEGDLLSAIYISGPTNLVTIENANVQWKFHPSIRSQGYGIAIRGWPSDDKDKPWVRNVTVTAPYIKWAPQAGIIYMGVSDVTTINPIIVETRADGVHHNACRRPKVVGRIIGIGLEDDLCPFVTYYTPIRGEGIGGGQGVYEPFGLPSLEEWSNFGGRADDVWVVNGSANAVRINGGLDIQIKNIYAENTAFALQVDSAITTNTSDPNHSTPGIFWTVRGSKKIIVGNVTAIRCGAPVLGITSNVKKGVDSSDYYLVDVTVNSMYIRDSTQFPFRLSNMEGWKVGTIDTTGSILFNSDAGNIHVDSIVTSDSLIVDGCHNVSVNKLGAKNLLISNVATFSADSITLNNAAGSALEIVGQSTNIAINKVQINFPNRNNDGISRAVLMGRGIKVDIFDIVIKHDSNALRTLEIGGGDQVNGNTLVSRDIYLPSIAFWTTTKYDGNGIVIQGGPYAPANVYYNFSKTSDNGNTWENFIRKDFTPITSAAITSAGLTTAVLNLATTTASAASTASATSSSVVDPIGSTSIGSLASSTTNPQFVASGSSSVTFYVTLIVSAIFVALSL